MIKSQHELDPGLVHAQQRTISDLHSLTHHGGELGPDLNFADTRLVAMLFDGPSMMWPWVLTLPALLIMQAQGQVILELWEQAVSNGRWLLCLTSTTSESVVTSSSSWPFLMSSLISSESHSFGIRFFFTKNIRNISWEKWIGRK